MFTWGKTEGREKRVYIAFCFFSICVSRYKFYLGFFTILSAREKIFPNEDPNNCVFLKRNFCKLGPQFEKLKFRIFVDKIFANLIKERKSIINFSYKFCFIVFIQGSKTTKYIFFYNYSSSSISVIMLFNSLSKKLLKKIYFCKVSLV